MTRVVEIDPREITITPVFKYIELENVPKSEAAGHLVLETKEVVEVRFAGSKNYSPTFPVDAMYRREGNQVITYAQRWADQFRAFKEGSPQEAMGTPLEMLRPHGVTPEQVSLCKALRIYSIEALHHLEGQQLKSLGMNANKLKDAARAFMASRMTATNALSEIEALKAEIEKLKAAQAVSTLPPVQDMKPEEIEAVVKAADDAFADMSEDELKGEIAKITGTRPRGNPSRATLVSSLEELLAA
ncbi:hypothetical protein [Rhizorhapis suberifaciens]|uniref:Uncharacterized protein n=1 Tax=Rhizorhapis suberifaciens TaxID=13656 RepID=A0A840HXX2_9SPHN|nr:hypothetical protein [Rhizorhapis suberifaciens]MBB4642368.1 hypothetical protein [Rhizorhapis suberifaciens]